METVIIKNQRDFDALPKAFKEFTIIRFESSPEEIIVVKKLPDSSSAELWGSSRAVLYGSSSAVLWESSRAVLWESSSAELWGSSSAVLYGSSSAELRGSSRAVLWESSSAVLWESSSAVLWESSRAVLRESSRAVLRESSRAVLWESSSAELWGSSSAVLWESSSAELWGSSSAVLWESSSAVLWESSRAVLRESSRAELWGSSSAVLWGQAAAHLYSDNATVILFMFSVCWQYVKGKVTKKSKTATIITVKASEGTDGWLESQAIEPKKKVILFKRVSHDFKTQENTKNETLWAVGTTVTHQNWNPKDGECGEGKFHACSRAYFCDKFRSEPKDVYVAIEVAKVDLYAWPNPDYPHKIAFRKGKVLYQCDKWGEKV